MTVQSTVNKIQHTSLADQTDFVYDFIVLQEEDMLVSVDSEEYLNGFTVDGIGDNAGGTVYLSTPQVAGAVIVLYRLMEPTQEIDYKKYDAFPAETHERGLDKLTLLVQQLNDFSIGSIRFPLAEIFGPNSILPPIGERSLKYLFFDSVGGVGVSDGTSIGGEGVKAVAVKPDSVSLLTVDSSNTEIPLIGVISVNEPNRLVSLDSFGKIPASAVPGVGFEGLDVTPAAVDMLTSDNVTNPSRPAVGTRLPNEPLSLIQLDAAGLIPPGLINFSGLRNLGLFRGDDLCDKAGDDPGECIVPDHRNPTERFPELTDIYQGGDYFIFTILDPEVDGTVNLYLAAFDVVTTPTLVVAGDGCIYFEELRDEFNDLVITEGWYFVKDIIQGSSAELVAYDPTGNLIILPADINVDLALTRLDLNVLDKQVGGIVGGPISIVANPTTPDHLSRKGYVDSGIATIDSNLQDLDVRVTQAEIDIVANTNEINTKISNDDYASETTGGTIKVRVVGFDAFFSTTVNNP